MSEIKTKGNVSTTILKTSVEGQGFGGKREGGDDR